MEIVEQIPDKEEYFHLFESTDWIEDYELSKDEVYKTLKNSWYHVFVYSDDQLIGCAIVICDDYMHALILDMIVQKEYRSEYVGSKIMKNILQR